MKVIIAGSRNITSFDRVACAVAQSEFDITEVVSGGARGVDQLGEMLAQADGIPVKVFRPNYHDFKRTAPLLRNSQMAEYADALVAVWDGQSRGTAHMVNEMRRRGKPVFVFTAPVPP